MLSMPRRARCTAALRPNPRLPPVISAMRVEVEVETEAEVEAVVVVMVSSCWGR